MRHPGLKAQVYVVCIFILFTTLQSGLWSHLRRMRHPGLKARVYVVCIFILFTTLQSGLWGHLRRMRHPGLKAQVYVLCNKTKLVGVQLCAWIRFTNSSPDLMEVSCAWHALHFRQLQKPEYPFCSMYMCRPWSAVFIPYVLLA